MWRFDFVLKPKNNSTEMHFKISEVEPNETTQNNSDEQQYFDAYN